MHDKQSSTHQAPLRQPLLQQARKTDSKVLYANRGVFQQQGVGYRDTIGKDGYKSPTYNKVQLLQAAKHQHDQRFLATCNL
jgi:hypothetical protein